MSARLMRGLPPLEPITAIADTTQSGLGRAVGSVLRDVAFGVGIVIAVLAGLLLLGRIRRRQAGASARRAQADGRHTGGFPAVTGGFPVLSSHGVHAARKGTSADGTSTTGGHRAIGGHTTPPPRARPRMAQVPRSGTLGPMGRPAVRTRATSGARPWAPARSPEAPEALAFPPADGADPALQAQEVAQPAASDATIPPWERVSGPLAAAPVSADVPTWPKVNTGPMYVWNPATNSGPFPAADQQPGEPGQRD